MKTAVICEDEIPAAQRLQRQLEARGFTVTAVIATVSKLKNFLAGNPAPDWLFLDIELRDGKVFGALKNNVASRIIFTTAYENLALEAFRHGGVDYLLKPIDEQKLDSAIEKIEMLGHVFNPGNDRIEERHFLVSSGQFLRKIPISQIAYFSSRDNITYLHGSNRDHPIGKSLEKLEEECRPDFFRISRKHLVNRAFATSIAADALILSTGERLAISRQRKKDVLEWFGNGYSTVKQKPVNPFSTS